MRISVLGLGRMGAPMARQLIEVGHDVTLYNRTGERTIAVAAKGAQATATGARVAPKQPRVAGTVADAVGEAQVALTMVSNDEAEEALTFGRDGLLAHLPSGAIHLCMSTIGLETSRKLALAHAEAGQGYVAAPVFGRPGMAVTGHLWIVAGGPDIQVTRCLTIFDALGRGVTRVGPRAELAHALKLGGNMLTVVMTEGLSEVLAYGEKAGMAPGEYLRLLNTAIFKSPMMDTLGGLMVRHLHDPADLTLDGALQDMQMVIQASEELDAVMPMAELLHQRLESASVQGWGDKDLTVLSHSCRMAAGLEGLDAMEESEVPRKEPFPTRFTARSREGEVELELELSKVTHFELIKDAVWAWTQGKRYCTPWKHLAEVERTFGQVPFLRLHRHILLQPEAALAHKSATGGAPKAFVEEPMEPANPNLEAHHSAELATDVEKQVTPKPAETPHPDEEKPSLWARAQDKYHPAGWRIPFLHLRPHIRVQAEATAERDPFVQGAPEAFVGEKQESSGSVAEEHPPTAPAMPEENQGMAELAETSHFEVENDVVWAWIQGKRVRTGWRSLNEIEAAFSHVILLRIQRNILLHPEFVLSLKPAFGGRSKVKVAGDQEFDVSRAMTQRLKELLGL